jgi:hypothetical protein
MGGRFLEDSGALNIKKSIETSGNFPGSPQPHKSSKYHGLDVSDQKSRKEQGNKLNTSN